jgi:two-component system, NtrC family, sensor kinase
MKTGIVGAGRGCRSLLELVLERGLQELRLDVRIVCDVRSHAPGILYAMERGIATTSRVEDVLRLRGLELVIELTGSEHAARDIQERLPPGVRLMDHAMAHLFWDLIQMEENLRKEREQVQSILDSMPDIVLVLDRERRVETVNAGFSRFTGLSHVQARGNFCHDVLCERWGTPEQRDIDCPFDRVLRTGKRVRTVQVRECAPGLEEHFEITMTPLRDSSGEITRVVESLHPITERIRLTQEVELSARRLKRFIDSAEDFISMKDLTGRYTVVNEATAKLFGLNPEDLIGKTAAELYPEDIAELIETHDREVVETRVPITFTEILHPGERELHLSTVRFPLLDFKGEVEGVCTISRDVTAEMRMQRQLVHTDKLAAIGKLSAAVAHEINNPLTGILAYAEDLLEEAGDNREQVEDCEVIIRETLRCREIVRTLLDFSKPRSPTRQRADLNEVVGNTVALVSRLAIFRDIELKQDLMAELPGVNGDQGQLQQVVLNFLVNAAEVLKGTGRILIRTWWRRREAECVLEVADNGPGIPDELIGQIFEPFFSTKRSTHGLGLAVSWSIIDRHGGRMEAENRDEGGASFRVILPVSEDR